MRISATHPSTPQPLPSPAFTSDLLLSEFIHRAANDLTVACLEVRHAGHEPSLERTRDRLETVFERLCALAAIQRLLQPPRHAVMNLLAELETLCQLHAKARFAEQDVFVQLCETAIEADVDAQRGWAMLMIVSELLTNAARHAFRGSGGLVEVEVIRHGGEIVCLVSDDGAGMAHRPVVGGCGGVIITELARSAGIDLRTRPCLNGTMFELRVPAAHD